MVRRARGENVRTVLRRRVRISSGVGGFIRSLRSTPQKAEVQQTEME